MAELICALYTVCAAELCNYTYFPIEVLLAVPMLLTWA